MNQFRYLAFLLLITLPLVLVRCTSGEQQSAVPLDTYEDIAPVNASYSNPGGVGYEAIPVLIPEQDAGTNVSFQYTLDLGASTKNVYFTFTNIDANSSAWYPSLDSSLAGISQSAAPDTFEEDRANLLTTDGVALRGTPEISEFNRSPWEFLNQVNPVNLILNSIDFPEPMQSDYEDAQATFKISATKSVNATCRYVSNPVVSTSFGNKSLSIWVDDTQWITAGGNYKITQPMVNALANKFLATGLENDIYDWVTNIYGEEWGDVSLSSLTETEKNMMIDESTSGDQITILLFDIDNDGYDTTGSYIVGYFWAKDNFKSSVISYSNERVMFYMDSVLYAQADGGSWDITDKWPETVISILSHEFQHMIHFYQKTVMKSFGNGSETWLDEMCALATEDLVANKVLVNGPRGVAYATPGPGLPNNDKGRLPLYNLYNDYSLTKWYSGDYVLVSYAVNYAFAAFLARNYGGAELFRNIVQNQYTDAAAIEEALDHSGFPGVTFGQVLQKWAVSNLLSEKINTTTGYWYNKGINAFDIFTSNVGGIDYTLGSIDLNNYTYPSVPPQIGPYIRDTMKTGFMPQASNYYYRAGTGLTGEQTWNIKLKSRVRMNVVVK